MVSESKRMPVTNFKKSDQSICQLSYNSAIFTSIQKICINDSTLSLPISIKSNLRHWRILHQLHSPASLSQTLTSRRVGVSVLVKIWPSQDHDMCPTNQKPPSLWSHFRSRSSPRGCFHPCNCDTLFHPEALPIQETSALHKITSATNHLWSLPSVMSW